MIDLLERKALAVKQAGPLALPMVVRDLCEVARSILVDHENRLERLERANGKT